VASVPEIEMLHWEVVPPGGGVEHPPLPTTLALALTASPCRAIDAVDTGEIPELDECDCPEFDAVIVPCKKLTTIACKSDADGPDTVGAVTDALVVLLPLPAQPATVKAKARRKRRFIIVTFRMDSL
jgi:hypothetical protein